MSILGQPNQKGATLVRVAWRTSELARRKPRSHHPTSRVVLGQRARVWPKCISHWSRGNTGTHPWSAPWASPMGGRPDPRTPVWPYRLNRGDQGLPPEYPKLQSRLDFRNWTPS